MPRIEYASSVFPAAPPSHRLPHRSEPSPHGLRAISDNRFRATSGNRFRVLHGVMAGALFAVLTLLVGCVSGSPSVQTPTLGQKVAATLIGDDGAPVPIPLAGSRFVVLEFWSPACEPCKQIIPAVRAKRAALEQKGATLLHVAVLDKDQSANDAKATLALWGVDERFVIDVDGAYMHHLGAKDVPAFAIIDAAGVLRWVAPDNLTISNLLAAIPE